MFSKKKMVTWKRDAEGGWEPHTEKARKAKWPYPLGRRWWTEGDERKASMANTQVGISPQGKKVGGKRVSLIGSE